MSYTYEEFVEALDANNKKLKDSLKFKRLAKTIFADTNKESVIINVNGTSYYRFRDGRKITLNLRLDGSLFFETNIDASYYYSDIVKDVGSYDCKAIDKFIECSTKSTCGPFIPIDSLIVGEYFSPRNIYYYFSQNIINQLVGNGYDDWTSLFNIKDDLRDLKNAKLVTYSKVKGTTDYKIKFKPSGNVYQLHYFTAPMARGFDGTEFFEAELNSYSVQFDGDKALMLDAVLADIYNEAKLIRDEILPEIKFTKTQIIDHYKASQMTIERELTESFNAYVSDVTNPVGYYMLYNDGNWQVVRKGAYNSIENGDYSDRAYVKFDRFQNRLIELHLPGVTFDKALDYYINN
jgi:hypothetical protein